MLINVKALQEAKVFCENNPEVKLEEITKKINTLCIENWEIFRKEKRSISNAIDLTKWEYEELFQNTLNIKSINIVKK